MAAKNAEDKSKTRSQATPLSPKSHVLSVPERSPHKFTDNALTFRDFTQTFDLSGALKKVADSNSAQEVFAPLRIVLGSLEALTKVHPFLAIVVIPFKAIVSLELRRRENDRRILALIMQMADMMSQLSVLPAQQAVNTIQQIQLQDILVDVKSRVIDYGNAIDVYYKTKLIAKIIKSSSWQEKLEEFAQAFSDLKGTLKMKLLLIVNDVAGDKNSVVSLAEKTMDEIIKLLRSRTEFELELSEFIQSNDGVKHSLGNDDFMKRLIKRFEGAVETIPDGHNQTQTGPELPPRSNYGGVPPPRRQGSGGSMYPEPNQYNQYYPGPPYSSSAGPSGSTLHAQDSAMYYSTAYPSHLQRRSSYSRPLSFFGVFAQTGPSRSASLTTSAAPPQPNGHYPAPSNPSRPTDYNGQTSGQAVPGQTSLVSTVSPLTSSQTTTPYSPQRTAMRTYIATRPLEEDVMDYSGSVKPMLLQQYRNEMQFTVSTHLNAMLKRNEQIWAFKLQYLIDDIKRHYGTNNVLRGATGAPHERIRHSKLKTIWEQEKWRGSVAGMQFLQAVQDFMVEESQLAVAEARSESWAVKFLGVAHRVPLLQCIDPEYSGFVSITEVNRFADEKPSNISLLMWFAYSACAWAYEANECRKCIHASWGKLAEFLGALANAPDDAIFDFEVSIAPEVDVLLGAIRVSPYRVAEFSEHPKLLQLLQDRLAEKEEKLKTNLEKINWEIDGEAALLAVGGTEPIEIYLLPLLSILIGRFVQRVEDTWTNLTQREIFAAKDTLARVLSAVDERVFLLVDCYPTECAAELSFGLYSQWAPKEWPTEPLLPKLSSAPQEIARRSSIRLEVVEEEPPRPRTTATSSESVISQTPTPSAQNSSDHHGSPAVSLSKPAVSLHSPQASVSTGTTTSTGDDPTDYSDVPMLEQLAMAPLFYVEAQHQYKATESSDMDLEVGDRIAVIATPESGWWIGKQLNEERDVPGRTTFPSNYVRLLRNLD